jgi:hypothetical protein
VYTIRLPLASYFRSGRKARHEPRTLAAHTTAAVLALALGWVREQRQRAGPGWHLRMLPALPVPRTPCGQIPPTGNGLGHGGMEPWPHWGGVKRRTPARMQPPRMPGWRLRRWRRMKDHAGSFRQDWAKLSEQDKTDLRTGIGARTLLLTS